MVCDDLELGMPVFEKAGVHTFCDLVGVISNAAKLREDGSAISRIEKNSDWFAFEVGLFE